MESKFCKLFETEVGQILVKADTSEDGEPEVRFYFSPKGLGICSMALTFNDTDEGWANQESAFEKITEESALGVVIGVIKDLPILE